MTSISGNNAQDKEPLTLTNILLISLIVLLSVLIILVIVLLKRKNIAPSPVHTNKKQYKNIRFDGINNPKHLARYINTYLVHNFSIPENTALLLIPDMLEDKYTNMKELKALISDINECLFHESRTNIDELKSRTSDVLGSIKPKKQTSNTEIKLNPE